MSTILSHSPRPEHGELAVSLLRGALIGALAGLVVGCFRRTHLLALPSAQRLAPLHPLLWVLFLVAAGIVISLIMDRLPATRSSGIPVVEAAEEEGGTLPWTRLLWAKFMGTWLGLLGGLSVGREGPCIEMGSAVGMVVASRTGHNASSVSPKGNTCLMAGAGAGLSAAFGAPLGGVAFVVEEMRCHCTGPMLVSLVTAAFSANAVLMLFGIGPMFAFANATPLPWPQLWMAVPAGILLGSAGAAYNGILLASTRLYARIPFPPSTRALPPLLLAGVLLFTLPRVLGGGEILIDALPGQADALSVLVFLLGIKLLFSVFCAASSVPGGLLMPMLCLGGMLGVAGVRLLGLHLPGLIPAAGVECWIVIGMAGFFAASVRAPLTGVALTLEMTGAWHTLPEALIVAFAAAKMADWLGSDPIYEALRRLPADSPAIPPRPAV